MINNVGRLTNQTPSHKNCFSQTCGICFLLVLLVAACSGNTTPNSSNSTSNTLVIDIQFDQKTADPQQMIATAGAAMVQALYNPLLTFQGTDNTKPVPDVASAYTVSSDGKTFTFTLRKNIKFTDGTPLTAQDVLFTYNRWLYLNGPPSFLLQNYSASAPDNYTFVITTQQPNPALPFIVTSPFLGILNSKLLKAHGGVDTPGADKTDTAIQYLNANSAGSGPYTLQTFSTTDQVILQRNDAYWGSRAAYKTVVFRNLTPATEILNVQKGSYEVAFDINATQAQDLAGMSKLKVQTVPSAQTFFIMMNSDAQLSPITANLNFQDAVRYGINYAGLVTLAGNGASQAPGIIPASFLGALSAQDAVHQDVARAKASLAKVGTTIPAVTMVYPADAAENGISFQLLSERVKSDLAQIGITINLFGAPIPTFVDRYHTGNAQMILNAWGADYPDPSDYLGFLPGRVVGTRAHWPAAAAPDVAQAGQIAEQAVTPSDRATAFQNVQRLLNQKSPFVFLIYPSQVLVSTKTVTNVNFNASWILDVANMGVA